MEEQVFSTPLELPTARHVLGIEERQSITITITITRRGGNVRTHVGGVPVLIRFQDEELEDG